jgi:hypothetical protein
LCFKGRKHQFINISGVMTCNCFGWNLIRLRFWDGLLGHSYFKRSGQK